MNKNFDELEKELFKDTDFVKPTFSGVYMVCANTIYSDLKYGKEKILYIGSSNNISNRILSSNHPYIKCFRKLSDHNVYTRSCETENFIEFEKYLIKKHQPMLNKKYR